MATIPARTGSGSAGQAVIMALNSVRVGVASLAMILLFAAPADGQHGPEAAIFFLRPASIQAD